jgi:hypothetical protein
MGSANSPSIAGKLGASFNKWETQFTYGAHDPRLGHGRVLIGDDELPQVLMWMFFPSTPLPGRSLLLA